MAIIITKDTLADINLSEEEFLVDIACYLYDKKRLSMGRARKLASLKLIEFQKELAKREIDIHYSEDDLQVDLENLGIELQEMIIVSDTSAITNLWQVNQLALLPELFGTITIPPAVQRELYVIPEQAKAFAELSWLVVKSPTNQMLILQLESSLDLGEAEAIALALEFGADYLLMDEYMGRKIAAKYDLQLVGVLGILILAKKKKIISFMRPIIQDLRDVGFI
ncbi:MAG: UPF0175 family protein [Bacteroidota bacterium]